MECPFCKEKDFDEIGLKHHLLSGFCDVFNRVSQLSPIDATKRAIRKVQSFL